MLAQVLTLTMMDHHRFLCQADDFGADEEVKTHTHFLFIHPSIHPSSRGIFFFLTIIYLLPCFFRLFGSIDLRSDEMALKKKKK
jgi:hypothetical protein